MDLGLPEILVILVIVLLFFGPSKIPALGKSIGEAIRGFKKGMKETEEAFHAPTPHPTAPPYKEPLLTHGQTAQSTQETLVKNNQNNS